MGQGRLRGQRGRGRSSAKSATPIRSTGKDIQLSIDLDVQQYAESLLQTQLTRIRNLPSTYWADNPIVEDPNTGEKHRMDVNQGEKVPFKAPAGSVIVMNQDNGQISAMASYPTFDNRWFNAGVSSDKFAELFPPVKENATADEQAEAADLATLTNRAVQGQYNLGSAFKPFTAYAALDSGLLEPNSYYQDTGYYQIRSIEADKCAAGVDCELRNAWCDARNGPCVYGSVNVYKALAVSSDTFFYKIGEDAYLKSRTLLKRKTSEFGFGHDTGIDLPFEFDGRVPDDAIKKQLVENGVLAEGEEPRLLVGDNIQAAIGQGLLAATPVQVATGYSALANGGSVLTPHVVRAIFEPGVPNGSAGYADLARGKVVKSFLQPDVRHRIKMAPEDYEAIVSGLRRNVTGPRFDEGSTTTQELYENGLYPDDAIQIAGKTGTAQGFRNLPWNDSSVFGGFSVDPERPYTVVSYLEKAGYGSRAVGAAGQVHVPRPLREDVHPAGDPVRSARPRQHRRRRARRSRADGVHQGLQLLSRRWHRPRRPARRLTLMSLSMLQRKPDSGLGNIRSSPADPSRNIDWILLVGQVLLTTIGCFVVYSATRTLAGIDPYNFVTRQVIFAIVAAAVMFLVMTLDYEWLHDHWRVLYFFTVVLLALLLILGKLSGEDLISFDIGPINIQPAEFAKVTVLLGIAAYVADEESEKVTYARFLGALILVGVPAVLVLAQPDLGGATVLLACAMGVLLVAGAKIVYILTISMLSVATLGAAYLSGFVNDYQLRADQGLLRPGQPRAARRGLPGPQCHPRRQGREGGSARDGCRAT